MSSDTATPKPDPRSAPRAGRVGSAFAVSRESVRIVYRDPEHVAERLTLYAMERLGEPAREWAVARRGDETTSPRPVAEAMCRESAAAARVDGAVAGTPFLIALVPGYVAYLWQEARMVLRIAALYGRDPRTLGTAAEMLVLRGVHPTTERAEQALVQVRDRPAPPRTGPRRPLRIWIRSVYQLLVFGGFLSPSEGDRAERHRFRATVATIAAVIVWVITWVLPVTFMIAMAWNCEAHTRGLAQSALAYYGADDVVGVPSPPPGSAGRRERLRRLGRALLLFLSVALPIAFVAYVNHVRQTVGVNWLGALGALVALSLVVATAVRTARA